MNTEIPANPAVRELGVAYYDAECVFCTRAVTRWGARFARRGFRWQPLQTPGTATRLGLSEAALRQEMVLALADGTVASGAAAWAVLLRSVWWLWPLGWALGLPGLRGLARRGYRWIARHRHCLGGACVVAAPGARRSRAIPFLDLP